MKISLAFIFLLFAIFAIVLFKQTGSQWAAGGAASFAIASICASCSILEGYKKQKR